MIIEGMQKCSSPASSLCKSQALEIQMSSAHNGHLLEIHYYCDKPCTPGDHLIGA